MSKLTFRPFVPPSAPMPLKKEHRKMSLDMDAFPPPLEPLLGMWAPLSRQPLRGITADGNIVPGLFSLAPCGAPTERIVKAAEDWLASLSERQRQEVTYPIDSREWRNWNNTPLILREPLHELSGFTALQRERALDIIRASLSARGFQLARDIMVLNRFLGELVQMPDVLGEWDYAMSIFGKPSLSEPWGWQFFGHHLALNCFILGRQMTLSPVFMGAEPDHIDVGPNATPRLFEDHESKGLELMRSLSKAQQKQATLYESMLTADQPAGRYHPDDGRQQGGAFQDNRIVPYEGVSVGGFSALQRRSLMDLVDAYLAPMPEGPQRARVEEVERYLDRTWFCWIGRTHEESPFYYRIQSPVVMIEFDHHKGIFLSNSDPERFHIHTIVRTPNGGDYGLDLLRLHYERAHKGEQAPGTHSHGHKHVR